MVIGNFVLCISGLRVKSKTRRSSPEGSLFANGRVFERNSVEDVGGS